MFIKTHDWSSLIKLPMIHLIHMLLVSHLGVVLVTYTLTLVYSLQIFAKYFYLIGSQGKKKHKPSTIQYQAYLV